MPEVRHFCPQIPFVLVGCKKDLRFDETTINELKKMNQKPVSFDDGCEVATKISAFGYLECSAKSKVELATIVCVY